MTKGAPLRHGLRSRYTHICNCISRACSSLLKYALSIHPFPKCRSTREICILCSSECLQACLQARHFDQHPSSADRADHDHVGWPSPEPNGNKWIEYMAPLQPKTSRQQAVSRQLQASLQSDSRHVPYQQLSAAQQSIRADPSQQWHLHAPDQAHRRSTTTQQPLQVSYHAESKQLHGHIPKYQQYARHQHDRCQSPAVSMTLYEEAAYDQPISPALARQLQHATEQGLPDWDADANLSGCNDSDDHADDSLVDYGAASFLDMSPVQQQMQPLSPELHQHGIADAVHMGNDAYLSGEVDRQLDMHSPQMPGAFIQAPLVRNSYGMQRRQSLQHHSQHASAPQSSHEPQTTAQHIHGPPCSPAYTDQGLLSEEDNELMLQSQHARTSADDWDGQLLMGQSASLRHAPSQPWHGASDPAAIMVRQLQMCSDCSSCCRTPLHACLPFLHDQILS